MKISKYFSYNDTIQTVSNKVSNSLKRKLWELTIFLYQKVMGKRLNRYWLYQGK